MHIHWWGIRFWAGIYIHISQNIELGKQRSQYIYSLPPDSLPANLTMAEKCHSNLSSLHGKRPSQHPRKAFSEVTFDCCQEHISIYSMSAAYEQVLFWECICGSNLFLNFGWPGGSDSKESACSAGDPGSIPGSGRSTPVLLPGKSHGQRSLVGYGPWSCKESDMTSLSLSLSLALQTDSLPTELPGKPLCISSFVLFINLFCFAISCISEIT